MTGKFAQLADQHVFLEELNLNNNQLVGILTAQIGWKSDKLRTIRLAGNYLSGGLPWTMGVIAPDLEILEISRNQLTGSLPDLWSSSLNGGLRIFDVADNRMEGTLPEALGELISLEELNVSGNVDIIGTIPVSLAVLGNLSALDITNTPMTGLIPEELCRKWKEDGVVEIQADCDKVGCCD